MKEQDPCKSILLDSLIVNLADILTMLAEEVKKQKIFKFNVFINEQTLNSALDQ
jgi:hypothetical protein